MTTFTYIQSDRETDIERDRQACGLTYPDTMAYRKVNICLREIAKIHDGSYPGRGPHYDYSYNDSIH